MSSGSTCLSFSRAVRITLRLTVVSALVNAAGCTRSSGPTHVARQSVTTIPPALLCPAAADAGPGAVQTGSLLLDVDPISSTNIWVVGQAAPGHQGALIEHWDGQRWKEQDLAGVLYSVVDGGPNDVWASGRNPKGAWITHWDGRSWTTSPTPPSPPDGLLISLARVSPTDIWAIGQDTSSTDPLIDHWDGRSWSAASTVGIPAGGGFRSSTVTPGGTVWAVGDTGSPNSS